MEPYKDTTDIKITMFRGHLSECFDRALGGEIFCIKRKREKFLFLSENEFRLLLAETEFEIEESGSKTGETKSETQ